MHVDGSKNINGNNTDKNDEKPMHDNFLLNYL